MNAELLKTRLKRSERVRARQRELGVEALLLSIGADLPWLTGYEAVPLERPTVLVFPADDHATLVVPMLEAPRVDVDERLFSVRAYRETEDAPGIIADLVGNRSQLAISNRAWASLLLALEQTIPHATWTNANAVTSEIRSVKDTREQAALKAAGAAADRVASALLSGEVALVGRTEAEVSAEISRRLLDEGHATTNFAIVGSGPNSASPHHEPGQRTIEAGDPVVCDFGGAFRLDGDVGYCSDTTRTVVAGEPPKEFRDLYAVLEVAQQAALDAVKPGIACEEIDRAARHVIEDAGLGKYFIHRTGHGIGVEEHEDPYIVEGNRQPAVVGNAFSIEPGIYIRDTFGARIEDIVIVSEDGAVACNASDHGLVIVDA
ncbi:MAG TPA: aminopeptidase P family protein [Acidimicrobiales bacterium]|nr:aminopeptidase P family protein [Acidimicrobiales bacterium]